MSKKILLFICIIVLLVLSFLIIEIRKNNDKEVTQNMINNTAVEENEITGEYKIYDENHNLIHSTEDSIEAEIYSRDSNFDMQMPNF